MIQHPISIELLRRLIRLDSDTGKLYWLPRTEDMFADAGPAYPASRICDRWNSEYAGKEALCTPTEKGYLVGKIFNRKYQANRVVFALSNGDWPVNLVDHKDGVTSNNMPGNLRDATRQENGRNSRGFGKTSGFRGVSWNARLGKWVAQLKGGDGRNHHLGVFEDEAVAARAHDAAAKEWHGEFARLNFAEAA